ncbi:MAG: hypothetical protein LBI44_05955 [Oscillospiraceae bacterium]|jgi:hypothetical protein|nr:hypothetical protein [Oscillospiraceae bacterium]
MNAEAISIAIGCINDDMLEEAGALRGKARGGHRKRWAGLAACVCAAVGLVGAATAFFTGFPILGARSGGNFGCLAGGSYYYATDFNIYRYAEGQRERLMSTFNVHNWAVDERGLYFTRGRFLYAREHETGLQRLLYTANTANNKVNISHLGNGQITVSPVNSKLYSATGMATYARIDCGTGELLWQDDVAALGEQMAIIYTGTPDYEFPVGGHALKMVLVPNEGLANDVYELYLDGEPFFDLSEDEHMSMETMPVYYGENLLINYQKNVKVWGWERNGEVWNVDEWHYEGTGEVGNILFTSGGEAVDLPAGRYIAGTDDSLIYIGGEPDHPNPVRVNAYDVKSGESLYLASIDLHDAATDGVWLFTTAPWSRRTDCWKLVYDSAGKLIGLQLWDDDI